MDLWILISGIVGVVLPPIIEVFAKKVEGKRKILVVFVTCLVLATIQAGTEQNLTGGGWSIETILQNFLIIMTLAVNMWGVVWKQWFPETPSPLKTNWNH